MCIRDRTSSVLLFGTLHILTFYYLYHSIKQDCEGTERFKGFFSFLSSTPSEGEEVDHDQKLYKYSIAIAFAYSLSMTFLAFDFMMSLHPHFYSTLFGVYYFMASVLAALGLVVIISSMMTIKFKLESVITQFQYYDAAKLMFGLSVFGCIHSFLSFFLYGMQTCLKKQDILLLEYSRSLISHFLGLHWRVFLSSLLLL